MPDMSALPPKEHQVKPKNQGSPETSSVYEVESDTTEHVAFASAARAAWFLDQVFRTLHAEDLDTRLLQLDGLDHALRTFLSTIMNSDGRVLRRYCTAIVLAIRTLYILHLQILNQASQINQSHKRTPSELRSKSSAVLNTLITMTENITAAHSDFSLLLMDSLPPSFAFIISTTISNMEYSEFQGDRLDSAKKNLDSSLRKFRERWES
ncbi:hypothetical protein PISL3812_08869 [Talaromyces islandicus]|uniref:Uncharacterized protein n=1 Tax=Talaromyces islandicus TaxID=28573 RepID=A0A0U1M893_TALIS|nr:hypothetical protein PISL3812_08869 [Talaromyces islandicus]